MSGPTKIGTAAVAALVSFGGLWWSCAHTVAGGLARAVSASLRKMVGFGDFCRFCGRTFSWSVTDIGRGRTMRLLLAQMFEVGTRSLPVVMITGAFVGMVLAAQSVLQFKAVGLEARLGAIVNLSVVRELGPVLAAVMLAGRVGGALSAELGTMRVTEQIDALRAMGADPIRVLVVPRFLACLLLLPFLVLYADFTGILGGYIIGVYVYQINAGEFWEHAARTVEMFDIFFNKGVEWDCNGFPSGNFEDNGLVFVDSYNVRINLFALRAGP